MTTTDCFQKKKDYYPSKEECVYEKVSTNPRYSYFYQTHFTAGDEDQFQTYRNKVNEETNKEIILKEVEEDPIFYKKYYNANALTVDNTFSYLFHKFKKAIFIQIRNNKLTVFLPFSKTNYTNEWGDKIRINPKYKDIPSFFESIAKLQNKPFDSSRINNNIWKWYGNNHIIRYEFPLGEGDSGVNEMSDMFRELCKCRELPDIEFFVNRRDSPLLTNDETESYDAFFGLKTPLLSHNYHSYSPILSMVTTNRHADIPIPTWEDWSRIKSEEDDVYFPDNCRSYRDIFEEDWDKKVPTAVFRGSSTGSGTIINDNPRLKIAHLSSLGFKDDKDNIPYLDAGITKWNLRPRKKGKFLNTIEIDKIGISLVPPLSPFEQSKYKYIVTIDGHVSAFRLSYEMKMGSVILLVHSKYSLWFSKYLKPYEHYIPIRGDLADLIDKIKWCKANDDKCREIAKNSKAFYEKYLRKEGILNYLQKIILQLKKAMGTYFYNVIPIKEIFLSDQYNKLEEYTSKKYPKVNYNSDGINHIPNQARSYSLNQGISYALNYLKSLKIIFPFNVISSFETRNSVISRLEFARSNNFLIKTSKIQVKNKENINECFIGIYCTNLLLKEIPNFNFIYGYYREGNKISPISEYHGDITFETYLLQSFNLRESAWILAQICLALEIAQRRCGFIHNDLYPWNIVLKKQKLSQYDYIINYDTVITMISDNIPIIIDYGRSSAILKEEYSTRYNLEGDYFQDIASILVSYLNIILTSQTISKNDIPKIISLANFLVGTNFYNKYSRTPSFTSLYQIKTFTSTTKKYGEITSRRERETKKPYDLFIHLDSIFNFKDDKRYSITNKSYNNMDIGNEVQVFNSIFTKEDTYSPILQGIKGKAPPLSDNILFKYYCIQSFDRAISSLIFIANDNQIVLPEEKIKDLYNYIEYLYLSKDIEYIVGEPEYEILYSIPKIKNLPFYDTSTFETHNGIASIIKDFSYHKDKYSEPRDILLSVFTYTGRYELPEDIRNYYKDNLDQLLKADNYLDFISDNNTFLFLTNRLSKENIKYLEKTSIFPPSLIDSYKTLEKESKN